VIAGVRSGDSWFALLVIAFLFAHRIRQLSLLAVDWLRTSFEKAQVFGIYEPFVT